MNERDKRERKSPGISIFPNEIRMPHLVEDEVRGQADIAAQANTYRPDKLNWPHTHAQLAPATNRPGHADRWSGEAAL